MKPLWIVAAVTAGVFAFAALIADAFDDTSSPRDRTDALREEAARAEAAKRAAQAAIAAALPPDAGAGPSVRLDAPVATSSRDAATIRDVMERARPQFLDCYRRADHDGLLPGETHVDVMWTLAPDGLVSPQSADGGTLELQACLEDVIGALSFPTPSPGGPEQESFTFDGATSTAPPDAAVPPDTVPIDPDLGATTPAIMFDRPVVDGGLDVAPVARVIEAAKAKLLACYQKALVDEPSLDGEVFTYFQIERDGKPDGITTDGLTVDVEDCVDAVLGKLRFPHPRGGPASVDEMITYYRK